MPLTIAPMPAPEPDWATVPRRVDRPTGAQLVSLYYFPVTARVLENWQLNWTILNGKACCETAALFAAAQAKLDAARPARPPPERKAKAPRAAEAASTA
jgi:hypothetical protein